MGGIKYYKEVEYLTPNGHYWECLVCMDSGKENYYGYGIISASAHITNYHHTEPYVDLCGHCGNMVAIENQYCSELCVINDLQPLTGPDEPKE